MVHVADTDDTGEQYTTAQDAHYYFDLSCQHTLAYHSTMILAS